MRDQDLPMDEKSKKKLKKLGLYQEGKTWVDKVVKETFSLMLKKSQIRL